jgi:hypothetical protein
MRRTDNQSFDLYKIGESFVGSVSGAHAGRDAESKTTPSVDRN